MADKKNELKLIRMNEVEATEIDWLWYPYIPYGKITVIQGDPGDGKTTAVLAIAAAVTTGATLPESKTAAEPMSVIFQTAEDGLGDTVKPRLVQSGADCGRVIVIDESEKELSLSDLRIEQAITLTGAKLFILDPLQAYLGADVDMHRANEIRPILKRISAVAEKTGCAVVVFPSPGAPCMTVIFPYGMYGYHSQFILTASTSLMRISFNSSLFCAMKTLLFFLNLYIQKAPMRFCLSAKGLVDFIKYDDGGGAYHSLILSV